MSEPISSDPRRRPATSGAPVLEPLWLRLKLALLSRDRRQQIRLAQCGLAILLMIGCVAMVKVLDASGVVDREWLRPWTLCSVGGMATFFVIIRSGLALRWRDPSLTLPQMYYSVLCAAAAYCISGNMRALVIPILAVVMMFGMFGMTRRQVVAVGVYTLAVFGTASVYWLEIGEPGQHPGLEIARFMMVSILMAGVVALTGRLQHLRERSREQRAALMSALQRLHELATHDELTGCLNRRAMLERMADESTRGAVGGAPNCVALIDLDHFKRVNDRFGHAAGDAVLRGCAEIMRSRLRGNDLLARWGGEEFLLMLGETDLRQACHSVQQLLDSLAGASFEGLPTGAVVTCSVGLVECRSGERLSEAIARSDVALYRAKDGGRNQVVCS